MSTKEEKLGYIAATETHPEQCIHKYGTYYRTHIPPCEKCKKEQSYNKIDSLESKLAIATEALEFYAEPMAWEELPYGDGTTYKTEVLTDDLSNVSKSDIPDWSPGKRAREALKKIKEGV